MQAERTAHRLLASFTTPFWVVLALALLWGPVTLAASSAAFVVIVHPQVSVVELDAGFVSDAFLKKKTRWHEGGAIRPADLKSDNPLREAFSKRILGRSLAAVRSYWQQRIFSGRELPPPELSEAAVLEYVARTEGAIGYISSSAKLDGVRVVEIR